jgi:hypothetical protein
VVPLVIVTSKPTTEHPPEAVTVTVRSEVEIGATVNVELKIAGVVGCEKRIS